MKQITFLLTIALCTIITACGISDKDHEAQGQIYLQKARIALQHKKFNIAKQIIKDLRDSVPFAIEARKAGILLMDSIELRLAQEELNVINQRLMQSNNLSTDTLKNSFEEACQKIKFYNRKLIHDKHAIKAMK
jgi:hypothetical protein